MMSVNVSTPICYDGFVRDIPRLARQRMDTDKTARGQSPRGKGELISMTMVELGRSYIDTSVKIRARMEALAPQLGNMHMSLGDQDELYHRYRLLEDMYWDTRSTGLKLLREYAE